MTISELAKEQMKIVPKTEEEHLQQYRILVMDQVQKYIDRKLWENASYEELDKFEEAIKVPEVLPNNFTRVN